MTHFNNVKSYEDLKAQYRALALANHPDAGGSTETMQAINAEYDRLFPVWKHRSQNTSAETAASTRSEFYTQYGWKGENYDRRISLKEIAVLVREFCKDFYSDCRFSVTTDYFANGCSLDIALTEGPQAAYKAPAEWTEDEQDEARRQEYRWKEIHESAEAIERHRATLFLSDYIKEATEAVADFANSYNYSDCDGQIDYFNVNFWFHGVKIGKWDKPYKIVPRQRKAPAGTEYETVTVTKTRTYSTLEPREIDAPADFAPGQFYQLKGSFNNGHRRGNVYKIDRVSGDYIHAYKMGKGYKNMLSGNVRGTSFTTSASSLRGWVEKGAIAFVQLAEVTKTEEYQSTQRRAKKQTGLSKDVRPPAASAEAEKPQAEPAAQPAPSPTPRAYTLTDDIDTRYGSPLMVLKFADRMSREEYEAVRDALKPLDGHYSKFKKGFIFRYNPAAALAAMFGNGQPQQQPAPEAPDATPEEPTEDKACAAQAAADALEDESTDIITSLRLRPGQYVVSPEYRKRLTAYIFGHRAEITPQAIQKIAFPELRAIVQSIMEETEEADKNKAGAA